MRFTEAYETHIKPIVQNLPEKPGCYQYLDETGTVIYVGKAKNLKRRVSSYFLREGQTQKTKLLVSHIWDLKYLVVETEWDALLLENNLIKRYKPRYNILLKDDKTYPSICITREEFPRVFKVRNTSAKGMEYFGPYSHVGTLNMLMDLISKAYHVRTCRLPISTDGIHANKYHECLEYHIHRCLAPCIGKQSHEEYIGQINEIREILKGRSADLSRSLVEQMKELAGKLEFEKAQKLKEKYDIIQAFTEKSRVVDMSLDNVDVFSIGEDESFVFLNYMHVSNGCINQAFTFEYKRRMDESLEDVLLLGMVEMKTRYKSTAREIIVPFEPSAQLNGIFWTVPQRGEKKKLLDLSELNVRQYRADRLKRSDKLNPEQKKVRLLGELASLLGMEKPPMRIECFDNSHIQGTNAVAACVVYEGGKPLKKEYRLYNIKSGVGGDDYASMHEVLTRRWKRTVEEGGKLPDLVLVDGGKGQMSVALQVADSLGISLEIGGLVKNSRHRTEGLISARTGAQAGVKPDGELFRLLEQMQDEVHRVAISFHKNKRSKSMISSQLTEISGIGQTTAETLIRTFKSVKRVSAATFDELARTIGKSKAQIVFDHFRI
ncbi:MAG: excinuclease ABC subunit UvrC [Bacteroidaceae bacterium]|nr:excinuclease ABC subunit UvrC [Bacteroidaceae bacterium]